MTNSKNPLSLLSQNMGNFCIREEVGENGIFPVRKEGFIDSHHQRERGVVLCKAAPFPVDFHKIPLLCVTFFREKILKLD